MIRAVMIFMIYRFCWFVDVGVGIRLLEISVLKTKKFRFLSTDFAGGGDLGLG